MYKHTYFSRPTTTLNDLVDNVTNCNYPPFNLIRTDEESQRLELAVAGFTKDDVKVKTVKGFLVVEGERNDDVEYLEKGISSRKFVRKWKLSKNATIESVKMKNGLLNIDIRLEIPESEKTVTYDIETSKEEFLQD